jgi:uncharacterized protein YegP (UPF0339 family)
LAQKKAPAKKKKETVADWLAVSKREDGWWWSAKAANGQEVANSGEGYKNRGYAYKMARSLFPGLPVYPG